MKVTKEIHKYILKNKDRSSRELSTDIEKEFSVKINQRNILPWLKKDISYWSKKRDVKKKISQTSHLKKSIPTLPELIKYVEKRKDTPVYDYVHRQITSKNRALASYLLDILREYKNEML